MRSCLLLLSLSLLASLLASSCAGSTESGAGTARPDATVAAADATAAGADATASTGGDSPAEDAGVQTTGAETTAAATGGGATGGGETTGGETGGETTGGETTGGETAGFPAVGQNVISLGVIETDANGDTGELTVELPENSISMAITAIADSGATLAVHDLIDPSGNTLAYSEWFNSPNNQGGASICINCTIRISAMDGAEGALIPNTRKPNLEVTAGTYHFAVRAYTLKQNGFFSPPTMTPWQGKIDVRVTFKQAPSPPETGVLDLNLFFTGAEELTAEAAQQDPRIQGALDAIGTTYAQVGISLGDVRYVDLPGALTAVESIQGPDSDFEALASLTVDAPAGINLIFVSSITEASSGLSGFGVILGVSGGIPGPTGVMGTGRSAVIVSLEQPAGAQVPAIGLTMAHEVGHYLGLFHSSEIMQLHDPIDDTAQGDPQNLMYFSSQGSTLSPDQGFVMRMNPWVHH